MAVRKWTLIGLVVTVAMLAGLWGFRDQARPARAQADPAQVLRQWLDALNAGDVDEAVALLADDAVVGVPCCLSECVGSAEVRSVMEFWVATNVHQTVISIEVSGNTMTASVAVEGGIPAAAGLDRVVAVVNVVVRDDKISRFSNAGFADDPNMGAFLAYFGANFVSGIDLAPSRDTDQTPGQAALLGLGSRTSVSVRVASGSASVLRPVHIHEGSCADLGAVRYPLQDIDNGFSLTVVDVPLADLRTGNLAINVARSQGESDVSVACGDIPAALAAEGEPVPEAMPAGGTNAGLLAGLAAAVAAGAVARGGAGWYVRRRWLR